MTDTRAEFRLATADLPADMGFFTKQAGLRLDTIFPADNPREAVLSGHGIRIRLVKGASEPPATLRILTDDKALLAEHTAPLTAPNGTVVEFDQLTIPLIIPETEHAFVVRRLADKAPWVIGRAGMQYRDLIPDRLGGSIIASHIRIPDGGPVPDMVHYHKVGFQLIFCVNGWVDVLYEDQGGLRRLTPGDCFIQPPEIRHRVMEASDNLQVIEIGVPAEHLTEIDHTMTLPTPDLRPDRGWQGQKFVHNLAKDADWQPFRIPGFTCRDTTINANTKGVAGVQVVRPDGGPAPTVTHDCDILFGFVMSGTMDLEAPGHETRALETGDAFVIPPGQAVTWARPSDDFELLEVSLPGNFRTEVVQP